MMTPKNVSLQLFSWQDISQSLGMIAILCIAATGALLLEVQRSALWQSSGLVELLIIMGVVSAIMVLLGVGTSMRAEQRSRQRVH